MPTAAQLSGHTGFLHFLFEETQGKIHVIVLYFDDDHGITSDAADGGALPGVSPG